MRNSRHTVKIADLNQLRRRRSKYCAIFFFCEVVLYKTPCRLSSEDQLVTKPLCETPSHRRRSTLTQYIWGSRVIGRSFSLAARQTARFYLMYFSITDNFKYLMTRLFTSSNATPAAQRIVTDTDYIEVSLMTRAEHG